MRLRFKGVGPSLDNVVYAVVDEFGALDLRNHRDETLPPTLFTADAAALRFKIEDAVESNFIRRGALPRGNLASKAREEILAALRDATNNIEWSAL